MSLSDEARHSSLRRKFEAIHFFLEEVGWVAVVIRNSRTVAILCFDLIAANNVLCPGFDTDERITRDTLSAFNRFEQERCAIATQFHIHADRCLQIGRNLAENSLSCGGF